MSPVKSEVYVTSFPDRGRKWQLSKDGGRVSDNGAHAAMSSSISISKTSSWLFRSIWRVTPLSHGSGSALFQTGKARGSFSVSPDGDRFLIVEREERAAPSQINLLVGWKQLFERRGDQ